MLQFLAQTGPRETTHFVILSRKNTESLHADDPLKITPQKQATGIVVMAYETLKDGVHQLCVEGVIPVRQRDSMLKDIEDRGLDSDA